VQALFFFGCTFFAFIPGGILRGFPLFSLNQPGEKPPEPPLNLPLRRLLPFPSLFLEPSVRLSFFLDFCPRNSPFPPLMLQHAGVSSAFEMGVSFFPFLYFLARHTVVSSFFPFFAPLVKFAGSSPPPFFFGTFLTGLGLGLFFRRLLLHHVRREHGSFPLSLSWRRPVTFFSGGPFFPFFFRKKDFATRPLSFSFNLSSASRTFSLAFPLSEG